MKVFKRLMFLALLMLVSVIPLVATPARATPNGDIPESMLDSYIMRAWEYIIMDVQKMKANGSIFVKYGSKYNAGIFYPSGSGCSGLEKVEDPTTVSGYAPNVLR